MTTAGRRSAVVAVPDPTVIAAPQEWHGDHVEDAGASLYDLGLTLFHDGRDPEAVGVFTEIVRAHRPSSAQVRTAPASPWSAIAALGHLMLVGQLTDDEPRRVIRTLAPLTAPEVDLGRTDPHGRALVLVAVGLARLRLGQSAAAADVLERVPLESFAAHRPLRAQQDVAAAARLALATARHRSGEPAPEAEQAADMLRLLGRLDAPTYDPYLVDTLVIAASDALRRGDLTRALNWSHEAVGTARACQFLGAANRLAAALTVLTEVLTDLGRFAEATRTGQHAAAAGGGQGDL